MANDFVQTECKNQGERELFLAQDPRLSLPQTECNAPMFCVLMLESAVDSLWLVRNTLSNLRKENKSEMGGFGEILRKTEGREKVRKVS